MRFSPLPIRSNSLGVLESHSSVVPSGGLYKITPKGKGKPMYVKGAGPWAFAAEKPEGWPGLWPIRWGSWADSKTISPFGPRLRRQSSRALRDKIVSDMTKGIGRDFSRKAGESEQVYAGS